MTYLTYPNLGRVGRLGNSMWELASTVGMARKLGMDPLFPPTWAYRPIFSVPDEMFGTEKGPVSSDLATELDPSERPYLQHRSLWADNEDEVLGLFNASAYARSVIFEQHNFFALPRPILSVHVRRGDLVQANNPTPNVHLYHPLRPAKYYTEAMAELLPRVKSVAVFGEDPEWNRANIPGDWYSDHPPDDPAIDWLDLFLISFCERHVLSNSTYGVWGAYLSGDQEAIYPENWYGPLVSADNHAMVLPGWREFPCEIGVPT